MKKKLCFLSFSGIGRKTFWPIGENFGSEFLKLLSRWPEEHFEEKFFLLELMIFLISGHWANTLKFFVCFFCWGCHNCIQCVHRNILMKIIIFEQKLLISFGLWVKKVRHFPIFYEVVKTAFCMSKGTIWARDYS